MFESCFKPHTWALKDKRGITVYKNYFSMTSCLYYWQLCGKAIIFILLILSYFFFRPIKPSEQSKQLIFLIHSFIEILPKNENRCLTILWKVPLYMARIYINRKQGSRCRSPMSQLAIFFLDWRLKSASGDLFGT